MNCWKDYVEYIKDNPEGYWFKRKLYGWGWVPARLQGWAVMIVYATSVLVLALVRGPQTSDAEVTKSILLPILAMTALFLVIAWRTGEPLKWQWVRKTDEN